MIITNVQSEAWTARLQHLRPKPCYSPIARPRRALKERSLPGSAKMAANGQCKDNRDIPVLPPLLIWTMYAMEAPTKGSSNTLALTPQE